MGTNQSLHQEVMEIDLRDLWFLFRRHFWKIILAAFVCAAIVFSVCRFYITPTYSATAKLYIVSASNDSVVNLSDLQLGSNLTSDYKELLMGRPMMESIIQKLDFSDETVSSLRGKISVENPSGTRVLAIKATMESPELAADVANTMAELAVDWLPAVMECNAPHIAENAVAPLGKTAPHTLRNSLIGAIAGAVLVYAIYALIYFMDDTITTAEDMEKYFNMTPMASIPFSKEAKREKSNMTATNKTGSRGSASFSKRGKANVMVTNKTGSRGSTSSPKRGKGGKSA